MICNCEYAVRNPTIVLASVKRVFNAIDVLLHDLPVYHRMEPLIQDGKENLQKAVLCTLENAKTCLAPYPHNVVECQEIYDMVFMEKAHFRAPPTRVQLRRWGYNLMNVVGFMEANNFTSRSLMKDDVMPLLDTILSMNKWSVC